MTPNTLEHVGTRQSFLNDSQEEKPQSIPWKQIATSAPVWAITATHVTQNFGKHIVITQSHVVRSVSKSNEFV